MEKRPGTQPIPMSLPFELETALERRMAADPDWRAGIAWGQPRPGHPGGAVALHVRDVLVQLDRLGLPSGDRERHRLVALVHESFKHRVGPPRSLGPPPEVAVLGQTSITIRRLHLPPDGRVVLTPVAGPPRPRFQ
jgi:hypothetical protein